MKHTFIFFVLSLFSLNALPSDGTISIHISLSPVGSFKITSENLKIKGLKKEGDLITAKKISTKKADLKTGIDLRDEHMKKRIKERTISVKNISAKNGKGSGEISINKIKKKISFNYNESDGKTKADFKLNLEEFGIKDINYLGVGVNNNVDVQIELNTP
tara:strand:- start:335 stop:814 length:480 start_codon:yes stop_codon:yes gene_type:complete